MTPWGLTDRVNEAREAGRPIDVNRAEFEVLERWGCFRMLFGVHVRVMPPVMAYSGDTT